MKVAILGAGPSGLFLGILLKRADQSHEVTVFERNPPDATFGWGVVFSEETLGALRDADHPSYLEITDTFARWDAIDITYRGEPLRSRGHGFSAIARKRLLSILQRRARELGVELRFGMDVDNPARLAQEVDLLVGADGVRSVVRAADPGAFGASVRAQGCKYIWYGTELAFDAFRFIFADTPHGLFQVHAYPFDECTSTFIVECPEPTWRAAGLDAMSERESMAFCEHLFADALSGRPLMSNKSTWLDFMLVRNRGWHGTVAGTPAVLVGDAAHTAHFTIGSGTKLAMEDAIALANALASHGQIRAALVHYERERQPVVERFQQAAADSADYFTRVRHHTHLEPPQFAFNLLTRSGRISHANLALRDAEFVRGVDAWFAGGTRRIAPPPAFTPLRLGKLELPNRIVREAVVRESGCSDNNIHARLAAAAREGAGLVLTDLFAVTDDGRVTPDTPVLGGALRALNAEGDAAPRALRALNAEGDAAPRALRALNAGGDAAPRALRALNAEGDAAPRALRALNAAVEAVHAEGAAVGVLLGHAGRRGATRTPEHGVDVPLPTPDAWPLIAPSALRYAPFCQVPKEMDADDLARVREAFAHAATVAADAGADLLELDCAHGRLLASFLSPLSNHRADAYGSTLEQRMRYPVEVLHAVRAGWPAERPLVVRLTVTDWARGGLTVDDGVAVARALAEAGADLIHVRAGQTVAECRPVYRHGYLTAISDRVRSEARVATLVGGHLTTIDAINTVLAAGRADACVADFPDQETSR